MRSNGKLFIIFVWPKLMFVCEIIGLFQSFCENCADYVVN